MFLGSAATDLFLRPDLRPPRLRAQGWSRIAEGNRSCGAKRPWPGRARRHARSRRAGKTAARGL